MIVALGAVAPPLVATLVAPTATVRSAAIRPAAGAAVAVPVAVTALLRVMSVVTASATMTASAARERTRRDHRQRHGRACPPLDVRTNVRVAYRGPARVEHLWCGG